MISLFFFAVFCFCFYCMILIYVEYRKSFFDILQLAKQKKDPYHKWRL